MAALDWRKPEDYTYTESLSLRQWAWEFLRRSRKYREMYAATEERWEKIYEGKQAGDSIEIPMDLFWSGTELGLGNQLPGPDARADTLDDLQWGWGVAAMQVDPGAVSGNPHVVNLAFNLALPIEPQLGLAREILTGVRGQMDAAGFPKLETPKVRIRLDRWTLFLRLLDARNAGESIAEMGRVLYGDMGDPRGSAQDALRRAEKLSESGYFQLVLKGEKSKRGGN